MSDRQPVRARVTVRPRFRCLVCLTFVIGTEHGTCPRCAWTPPTLAPIVPRSLRAWPSLVLAATLAAVAVAVAATHG